MIAPKGLRTFDDPNAIYFFRYRQGSVESCPDCILWEYREDAERIAAFVNPESTCSLRNGDAVGVRSGPFEDKYSVLVELSESGRRSLSSCAALKESKEHFTPAFLVFVGDKFVGSSFVHPHSVETGLLSFFGTEDLEPIAEVLRPATPSNVEL